MREGDESIAEYLDHIDAERFVGRRREQELVAALLGSGGALRLLWLYGEGGVGKSTMVRQAARLGRENGYEVVRLDGERLSAEITPFESWFASIASAGPQLLLIDSAEFLDARAAQLRDALMEHLPSTARVVVAGRRPPDGGWRRDGWEHLADAIELLPLDDDESGELLMARGVTDPASIVAVVQWAEGLPLALATSCETESTAFVATEHSVPTSLARMLLERVVEPELSGHDTAALEVAAIAPVVDRAMLQAVLGDKRPLATMNWMRTLSFVETRGDRSKLHHRLRRAVSEELSRTNPVREQQLHLAVADHLHDRALDGAPELIGELRLLVEPDDLRFGMGESDGDPVYADTVRSGDAAALAAALGAADEAWWPRIQRWFDEGPEQVVVLRDRSAVLVGAGIWVTPMRYPAWAVSDPVFAPILEEALRVDPTGNAVVLLDSFDLLGAPDGVVSPVIGTGNTAVISRCGLANIRRFYSSQTPEDAQARAFLVAAGFHPVPEIDLDYFGRRYQCQVVDHGPGGLIGAVRDLVYRARGVEPSRPSIEPLVRSALRSFHNPAALLENPLSDRWPDDPVTGLREVITRAIDTEFGDSEREIRMRDCVLRGYIDDGASHASARASLFLSKSAYFRWLDEASARLSAGVAAAIDDREQNGTDASRP